MSRVRPRDERSNRLGGPRVQAVAAALGFVALSLILVPWSPLSASLLPNGPGVAGTSDASLSVWLLAWLPFAMWHGINPLFSHLMLGPATVPVAHMNTIFALSGLGTPATLLWGPVATYNVLLRLAFATSAFSLFLVMRRKVRFVYALGAGLLFGFGPFEVAQGATHLDVAFTAMLPLIVWLTYELVIIRRRNALRLGCALGVACAVQYFVMSELLFSIILVMAIAVVVPAFRVRLETSAWRYLGRGVFAAAGAFVVLCGYPVYELLFTGPHGPVHPAAVLEVYRNDLFSSFLPTTYQLIHPGQLSAHANSFVAGNLTENGGYLGLPLIATSLWFGYRFRRDRFVVWPLVMALIAFVLSLGPRLTVDGHDLPILLPEAALAHLPLLNNVVSARFAVVVALFVAMAVAIGAQALIENSRFAPLPRRRMVKTGTWVVALLVTLTLLPSRYSPTSVAPSASVHRALSLVPDGAVVLTYPYAAPPFVEPMIWDASERLRFTLVGGYDGVGVQRIPNEPVPVFFGEAQYFKLRPITASLLGEKEISSSRQYLADHHVGVIIVQDTGADAGAVVKFLDIVTGPATYRFPGVTVWLRKQPGSG